MVAQTGTDVLERNLAESRMSRMSRPNNQQSQSGVCTLESSQFHKGSCTRMFTATAVEIRSWGHPSVHH